ncbi:MAG: tetratricopeptide repeat protein, partial [Deltaproteobacteria bacterium]|nr:tetratricopeptide repeat protein [Deltaproteobacteria bacterium]
DQGIAAYKKLVQKFPKNSEYHFMLGDVYEWRGRLNEALREYLLYLDLRFPTLSVSKNLFKKPIYFKGPLQDKDIEVFDHIILIKTEQKKMKDAQKMFESLETSFPNQKEWVEKRARFYVATKELDLALHVYQKLSYRYEIAQIYIWKNQMNKALSVYEELIEEDPHSLRAHLGLASAYAALDKPEEAYQEYEWILKGDPQNEAALEGVAQASLWTHRMERGLEAYRILIQKHPQKEAYRRGLGLLYFWLGAYPQAQVQLEPYLKKHPHDWEVKVALADIYGATEQVEKQDRYYKELIFALEKKSVKTKQDLELLARGYFVRQEFLKAQSIYEELLEKNPKDVDLKIKMVELYAAAQDFEKAYTALQAIDTPLLTGRQKQQLLLMRASLYDSIDASERAEALYREALTKDPELKEAQRGLLPLLYEKKEYFEANRLAKDLKDTYSLWIQEELHKQTALKTQTKFRLIETIDKKSTIGEYTHEYEGMVTKYLWNRLEAKGRYQYATLKDTALTPQLSTTVSTVGMGLNYDVTSKLKAGLEPQFYTSEFWTTAGALGEVQWHAADNLYFDVTGQFHRLWTNPVDAVRFKGLQNGGEVYGDYKPFERLNIISSGGFNTYSVEQGAGEGWARVGTFKTLVALWLVPKIEVGYFFDTQYAWQNQRLVDTSALVHRIEAHYLMGQFDYKPFNSFRLFMNGAIGEDQKRQLTLDEGALFNYLLKGEWQVSDRLFLEGLYSYSSQSSKTASGIQAIALGQLSYFFH